MIRRTVYAVLGAVELAVDVYDFVARLVTGREKPFPMKPKASSAGAAPKVAAKPGPPDLKKR